MPGFAVVELSTADVIVSAFGVTAPAESVMLVAVSVTAPVLLSRAAPSSSSEVLLRAQARPARTVASSAERIIMVERCTKTPYNSRVGMLPPRYRAERIRSHVERLWARECYVRQIGVGLVLPAKAANIALLHERGCDGWPCEKPGECLASHAGGRLAPALGEAL